MPELTRPATTRDLSRLAGRMGAAYDILRGRGFGPGMPLPPQAPEGERPGEPDAGPRQFEYPVSINTRTAPRSELPGLTPFAQLRNLARLYPPAAICVRTRIEEFQGLKWSIVAKNKRHQERYQEIIDQVEAFWKAPDKVNEFSSWLAMLLRDSLEIDALTLYPRKDKVGRLYALEPIDGATIKPLLDLRGHVGGYQQILYGLPWSNEERQTTNPDEQLALPQLGVGELIYRPRMPRTDSPYGLSPVEDILLNINMGLRKMTGDLAHFTDGNIPPMLITPPDGKLDAKQVAQFEEWFNAVLAGNDTTRSRAKFLPWPADVKELRAFSYVTDLDLWMLQLTFAAFGVPPQEAGFTQDVNRATADAQENINERRGLKPLAHWLKGLFDLIIQRPVAQGGMGCPFLEWQWDFGESEDRTAIATIHASDIEHGVISPAESRTLRYGDVLDGPPPPMPAAPQNAAQQTHGDLVHMGKVEKRGARVRSVDELSDAEALSVARQLAREITGDG
ncbi:MAG: phage portal protein [Kouleothrix sp.]|nr:phage portal protein [Kouleothrix sp.]